MCSRKFQKNNKKIKKNYYELISSQNRLEIDEKEGNKNYCSVPFHSVPTRCVIENSKKKNSKKIQKIKTIPLLPHFRPKWVGRG